MTTPNNNTAQLIVADAMFDAGLLEQGQSPNSEQLVLGMRKLNDVALFLQVNRGLKLWLNYDLSITLVESQGTYLLGPASESAEVAVDMTKPFRVVEAYYLDSSNVRRPLIPLAWKDYITLSQITQEGAINSYFVDKQKNLLSVFFWLIPDATAATGTGHLVLQKQADQVTTITQDMTFPVEWRMPLRWSLAYDLSTGQPEAIVNRCKTNMDAYVEALEDWDVEDAPTQFQVDQRAGYSTASFT